MDGPWPTFYRVYIPHESHWFQCILLVSLPVVSQCLSLSSQSVLSALSFGGKVVVAEVGVEGAEGVERVEGVESRGVGNPVVLASRAPLAVQVLRNPQHRTVAEVVNRRPLLQVNCLLDAQSVEALDPRFMGIGLLSIANVALFDAHVFHSQAIWKRLSRNRRKGRGWAWIPIRILASGLGRHCCR